MKLTIVLLLFFTFRVTAKTDAQKITIVRNNIHLSEVFKDIEQQTGFHFFYDKDLIQKTGPIDVRLKMQQLSRLCQLALKGPATYLYNCKQYGCHSTRRKSGKGNRYSCNYY